MKGKMTWGVVGALAIAASVGISLQTGGPGSGKEKSGAQRAANARHDHPKKSSAKPETAYELACDDLAEALEFFLALSSDTLPRPESCYDPAARHVTDVPKVSKGPSGVHLKFVIATLPDPIHTHLPLLFDRLTEVIQEAAQDEHYSYEISWLPWEDQEDPLTYLLDQDEASKRTELKEQQPGILLFRRNEAKKKVAQNESTVQEKDSPVPPLWPYQDGLVVLVVGEDPTRGIHLEQFENALAWISDLRQVDSGTETRTAMLGPSFSGSFASLEKLLSSGNSGQFIESIRKGSAAPLAIYSGTANSRKAIAGFQLAQQTGPLRSLDIDFHGFLEYDEVALERYCRFVNKANRHDATDGFRGSQAIAVISEDDTAFGSSTSDLTACLHQALWLYYPRDISALRAAYQTNSIFSASAPQQLSDVGRGNLPSNIADPEGKEHDTIRSYAGDQTPLSQEAYLLGLVNAMREAHTQYVILRSTNALDQIFLARYLRRAYPDARIVIDGADRLFERERGSTGMGGAMSLSTYPLLERERDWTADPSGVSPEPQPGHRSFNSDFSEGTYIALRLLLHTKELNQGEAINSIESCDRLKTRDTSDPTGGSLPNLKNCSSQVLPPLPDYGMPSWVEDKNCSGDCDGFGAPATWLTVIGRDGFWAIAAINEKTTDPRTPDRNVVIGKQRSEVPLSLQIGLLSLLLFIAFHAWCCGWASFTAKPAFRTHFANPGSWQHTLLIFLGSWFAAILPLFAGWACGVFDPSAAMLANPWWMLATVMIASLAAVAATILNISRVEALRIGAGGTAMSSFGKRTTITRVCVGSAAGILFFFAAFALPLQHLLTPANRFFTYYRSMHILSGVSPIVPFLALTIGMYLWFWYSLHGLALFGSDRCRLPDEMDLHFNRAGSNQTLDVLRMFSQQAANDTEHSANPLHCRTLLLALILCSGFLLVTSLVSRGVPVRSLGSEYYATIVLMCLAACSSLMLALAWQLLTIWGKLRGLLMFLDRTALRRTLAALRGFSWGSVWTMSGNVLDVRYKLLSRQLESLHHVRAALHAHAIQKSADAARCCMAARHCMAALDNIKNNVQGASGDEALAALKQMRKSAEGSLVAKLDAARDCIVAQKQRNAISADPAAAASVQDCITALETFVSCGTEYADEVERSCIAELDKTEQAAMLFAVWYTKNYNNPDAEDLELLADFQKSAAKSAGVLLVKLLLPEWHKQKDSLILEQGQRPSDADGEDNSTALPLSTQAHIRNAEEFVCLPYLGFVQNILGRMRTIVMSVLCLFVATAVAISSYPFDPRQGLSGSMLALFLVLGALITYVYAQMHKDATLSHVTNTTPGELGGDFWFKLLGFGAAPLLGLLSTVFPSISDFVFSWLQPGLQSIK
jgi:hypothetical protein